MSTADEVTALREATRAAHEALKDLRQEHRAVKQLVAGIEGRVQRAVEGLLHTEIERQVAELAKVTDRAMRDSVAKVGREFDRLERILTGREDDGRPSLEEQFRTAQASGALRHVVARGDRP